MQPQFYSESPTPYIAPQPKRGFWSKRKILVIGSVLTTLLVAGLGVVSTSKPKSSTEVQQLMSTILSSDASESYKLLGSEVQHYYTEDSWGRLVAAVQTNCSGYTVRHKPTIQKKSAGEVTTYTYDLTNKDKNSSVSAWVEAKTLKGGDKKTAMYYFALHTDKAK